MTHPRDPELTDTEAARLLREIANKPQAAVIWPLAHGRWSGNVVEALLRGAERLEQSD